MSLIVESGLYGESPLLLRNVGENERRSYRKSGEGERRLRLEAMGDGLNLRLGLLLKPGEGDRARRDGGLELLLCLDGGLREMLLLVGDFLTLDGGVLGRGGVRGRGDLARMTGDRDLDFRGLLTGLCLKRRQI